MPILDLLNPNEYVNPIERARRVKICEGCPRLWKFTRQCGECLCFIDQKTKLKTEKCDLKKW